ncbi:isoprenylcysteine carboxylmethyltransferase family protein [Candidatus Woesearchaeota archaeon]|nr:isoprenylcysteine carboxylmethyltransferase family protein [Candidatus Woesearchaeota archaeon]
MLTLLLGIIVIVVELPRLRRAGGAGADRGSLILVLCSIFLALGAILVLRSKPSIARELIGSAVLLAGFSLRTWAIRILGRHFSVKVALQERHELVTSGPYALLRHPAYTGLALELLGFGLGIAAWQGALACLIVAPSLAYRIAVEERFLTAAMGERYKEYSARTARLIPWLL